MGGSLPTTELAIDARLKGLAAHDDLFCPGCGYDLRGSIGSGRCPECGLAIDRATGVSRIPWAHRRRIGRVRAYWRTVWLATFRIRQLGDEVNRAVNYHDAQRFRLVTVVIATLAAVGVLAAAAAAGGGVEELANVLPSESSFWAPDEIAPGAFDAFLPWVASALMPPVLPLAILLFFLLLTGVASYWFHPRSLPVVAQNRAVALSHYACAPLVFLWLPAVVTSAILLAPKELTVSRIYLLLGFIDLLLVPLIPIACYVVTLRLLRLATGARVRRMILAACVIPASWAMSAVLALAIVPWLVGFAWLVIDSLR